jgi:hypothetical protein
MMKEESLNRTLAILDHAKRERDKAEVRYREALKGYEGELIKHNVTSHTLDALGRKVIGTRVTPTTLVIDEQGLAKAVGPEKWEAVSKRVLDKKLLEHSIVNDEIQTQQLADNSEEVAKTPYVRVTTKESGEKK